MGATIGPGAAWERASEPYSSEPSMRPDCVWRLLAWGTVAGAVLACHDTKGVPTQQGPLAGLRYVNVVSDTGPLDIRIVDIVGRSEEHTSELQSQSNLV